MVQYEHDSVVPQQGSVLPKKQQVADMFNHIAFRYDFMNRLLSAGIDVRWRKAALKELEPVQPHRILDVATGTADVAILAARQFRAASITGIDISEGMLDLGRKKIQKLGWQDRIELLTGDSEKMLFPDHSFDAVTVAFGVRNFEHLEKGLAEILRVLRPGGKLVVLEFSRPKMPVVKQFYQLYMKVIAPGLGKLFSKNRGAYRYLDQSIQKFPEGSHFTRILEGLGYRNTYCKPKSAGICSVYCGEK